MSTYADLITDNTLDSCNEVYNAGSLILLGRLPNCQKEPTVYTLTVSVPAGAETNADGDTIEVYGYISSPSGGSPSVTLRKGHILNDGTNTAVVAEKTTITATTADGDPIPIEPVPSGDEPTGDVDTWGLLSILSPTSIPLESSSDTVSRYSLTDGLQQSEVKTNVSLSISLEMINQKDDEALHDILFRASQNTSDVFAFIRRGDNRQAWGSAKVTDFSDSSELSEISRPSATLMMQAPYALPPLRKYLSSSEQTTFDSVTKLAGLPMVS